MRKKNRKQLVSLLRFTQLTHDFQRIKRRVRATGEFRWETNAEHTHQLRMHAWYLIDRDGLKLDRRKVSDYIDVHDFPEVYAGDPCIFVDGAQALEGKEEREAIAQEKLRQEFPEFPSFHKVLEEYRHLANPEARFVYALDKLVPFLNIMLDEGKSWKQFGTTLSDLIEAKGEKIRKCPICTELLDILIKELESRNDELFPPKSHECSLPQDQILPLPPVHIRSHEMRYS